MKFNSRDWIYVTGKAYTGKTSWIREHIKHVPPDRLFIFDFTGKDYQDLADQANIYLVNTGSREEIEEFLTYIYQRGNCTAVLSESDNYMRLESPIMKAFVTTGRNRGINAIIDGKRPMSVLPAYRSRFNYLVLFATQLPEDIEYLERWTGTGKGSLDFLNTMELGEHVIFDLDRQKLSEIQKLHLSPSEIGRT